MERGHDPDLEEQSEVEEAKEETSGALHVIHPVYSECIKRDVYL